MDDDEGGWERGGAKGGRVSGWWIGGWKGYRGGSSLSAQRNDVWSIRATLCGGEIFNPFILPYLNPYPSRARPWPALPRELMVTVFIKMTVMHSRKLDPSARLGSSFLFRSPPPSPPFDIWCNTFVTYDFPEILIFFHPYPRGRNRWCEESKVINSKLYVSPTFLYVE